MYNFIKKFFNCIFILIMLFSLFACKSNNHTDKLIRFIDDCFEKNNSIQIYDNVGSDVTASALSDISSFYNSEDYQDIKDYLYHNKYTLGYMNTVIFVDEQTIAYEYLTCHVVAYPSGNIQEIITSTSGAFEYTSDTYELIAHKNSACNMDYCDFEGTALSFRTIITEQPSSFLCASDVEVKENNTEDVILFRSRYLVDINKIFFY